MRLMYVPFLSWVVTVAYVGLTENTFKTRLTNHKTSFNNPSKRMSTKLSRDMYGTLKTVALTSGSPRREAGYNPSSKRCNLCLWEKYFIICKPHLATLNKYDELVSSCTETLTKFLLKTFKFYSIT